MATNTLKWVVKLDDFLATIPSTLKMNTGWCPPSYVCWFISPSEYNYLRIINYCYNCYNIVIGTNLANELGPHPAVF